MMLSKPSRTLRNDDENCRRMGRGATFPHPAMRQRS